MKAEFKELFTGLKDHRIWCNTVVVASVKSHYTHRPKGEDNGVMRFVSPKNKWPGDINQTQ